MHYNYNQEILPVDALPVSIFLEDMVKPELLEFELDLTLDYLTLYFSETVNVSSLDASQITLQQDSGGLLSKHKLTGGYSLFMDDPVVTVKLLNEDLNVIKQLTQLATEMNNTYLSLSDLTILDMNGNNVVMVPVNRATGVTKYTDNEVRPQLTAFGIDLNASILTLSFSETVNSSTLEAT